MIALHEPTGTHLSNGVEQENLDAIKKAASKKRKAARLRKEEAEQEKGAFLLAASAARDFAFYDGVVDAKVIFSCNKTIEKWTALLAELEERMI